MGYSMGHSVEYSIVHSIEVLQNMLWYIQLKFCGIFYSTFNWSSTEYSKAHSKGFWINLQNIQLEFLQNILKNIYSVSQHWCIQLPNTFDAYSFVLGHIQGRRQLSQLAREPSDFGQFRCADFKNRCYTGKYRGLQPRFSLDRQSRW